MGHLFGSKKQEYQARTEAQTIETFRILSLMYCDTHDDMKTSDIGPLERKMFGKTFEDLLQEGYMVTLVIEDKESGDFWTAFGKAQKEDDMQESAVLQDDADLDQSHHSRMSRQKAGTSTSKDSPIKFVLVELYEEI